MLKARHVGRYATIARLLVRHGRHNVLGADPLTDDVDLVAGERTGDDDTAGIDADAEHLAHELEAMGPTFVKLGQLLSTRADVLPPAYLGALARLQDDVAPVPFAAIRGIVEHELGVRLSRGFASFEERPAAAASLGQVHRATLRDGRVVAVKVQRPGVRAQAADDMDVIQEIAAMVDSHTSVGRRYGFAAMADEFRSSLMQELDYEAEAANLRTLHDALAGYDRLVVPKPIDDYTTPRVLTMDWVSGRKLSALGPLARLEVDGAVLADQLVRAYLDQILLHGLFHADPHPGNVLLTDDHRLALIDLGMVARVSPEVQDRLIRLLLAVSGGRGGDVADVIVSLGVRHDDFDRAEFRRKVQDILGRVQGAEVRNVQAGRVIAELLQAAADSGVRPPAELTMIGKALLNLDEVARVLDEQSDPNATIVSHVGELMASKLRQAASPSNVVNTMMDAMEFVERLPSRVNKVMDALAEGQLTLNVRGIDEREIMRSVQKLANRITTGVVVAALVIGAALIMRIDAHPKLWGYPAIAIVLFLFAAAAAACLLLSIVISDLPQQRRRRSRR